MRMGKSQIQTPGWVRTHHTGKKLPAILTIRNLGTDNVLNDIHKT